MTESNFLEDLGKIEPLSPPIIDFKIMEESQPPYSMNAKLHFCENMDYGYTEGYRRASELLFSHIKTTSNDQDTLVYPICFLVRHELELRLKNILELFQKAELQQNSVPKTHNLETLWNECKPLMEQICGNGDLDWFPSLDTFFHQLQEIDPTCDGFRYKQNTKGEKTLGGRLGYLNLEKLCSASRSLGDWLEAAEGFLADCIDEARSGY